MDTEYTLGQTAKHEEFKDLFEGLMEGFLSKIGATTEGLYETIQQDSSNDFYSGNTLVAVINSAVEFKAFHAMMCDARAGELVWGMPPLMDEKTGELFCS
jgi:hypothetical protein